MKLKDYAVIDINWIDDKIITYNGYIRSLSSISYEAISKYKAIIDTLEELKQQLQPLLPICEKCFDEGKNQKKRAMNAYPENFSLKKDKQDFLNSEIQLP